jgi:hypothetical protein
MLHRPPGSFGEQAWEKRPMISGKMSFHASLAAALLLLPQAALAGSKYTDAQKKKTGWAAVCPLDVQDYCKGVKSKKMRDCLLSHKADLTPRCAQAVHKLNPDDLF